MIRRISKREQQARVVSSEEHWVTCDMRAIIRPPESDVTCAGHGLPMTTKITGSYDDSDR